MKEKRPAWQSTLKSTDTEEFLDMHFYRPLGYRWALLFQKTGISPNQVTLAAIFIGIAAAFCFYFTSLWINLLGVFLLVWGNTFDSADGQLARMTNKQSFMGRILDGICGDCWFIAIYFAIVFRLWPEWQGWIVLLGLVAGYFHFKQAAMADYYRNVHLLFLQGKSGDELHNSHHLAEEYEQSRKEKSFLIRIIRLTYLNYTRGQEKQSPHLQAMLHTIQKQYRGNAPEGFREVYREKSLPLLIYTNLLSFNLRSIVLFISVLSNYPWVYFVFELTVMNGMLYYMISRYETICKQLTDELEPSITG
ncbi:hypothetical protein FACS1894182_13070 [Bacteroidia bacterium]|nr:hypothetical protein FACS1894182_13070 [Bacteroidia bacterium]